MARTISDNPSGWSKTLPGHTVEYDSNYALPWSEDFTTAVGAGGWGTVALTITDDDYIYIIDMVSVTPQIITPFAITVRLNTVLYMAGAATGWINVPLSQNPSLQFVTDDLINVYVNNQHTGTVAFLTVLNGTKIPKPAGWTHGAF